MPNNVYNQEDQGMRFDSNRMIPPIPNGGYGYENHSAQTWNPNAFGNNQFPSFGGTGRMKSGPRGRSALPQVSVLVYDWRNGKLTS